MATRQAFRRNTRQCTGAHANIARLANADDLGPQARAAVEAALRPMIEQLHHDAELLANADPGAALVLLVDVLRDLPGNVARADRKLAAVAE